MLALHSMWQDAGHAYRPLLVISQINTITNNACHSRHSWDCLSLPRLLFAGASTIACWGGVGSMTQGARCVEKVAGVHTQLGAVLHIANVRLAMCVLDIST